MLIINLFTNPAFCRFEINLFICNYVLGNQCFGWRRVDRSLHIRFVYLNNTIPFLLSIRHYPSFSLSYIILPSHYPTLSFLSWSFTALPSPLNPTLPFLPSILHYPYFSLSYTNFPFLYPTGYSTLHSPFHSALPRLLLPGLFTASQRKIKFD